MWCYVDFPVFHFLPIFDFIGRRGNSLNLKLVFKSDHLKLTFIAKQMFVCSRNQSALCTQPWTAHQTFCLFRHSMCRVTTAFCVEFFSWMTVCALCSSGGLWRVCSVLYESWAASPLTVTAEHCRLDKLLHPAYFQNLRVGSVKHRFIKRFKTHIK